MLKYVPEFILDRVWNAKYEGSFEGMVLVFESQNFSNIDSVYHGAKYIDQIQTAPKKKAKEASVLDILAEQGGFVAFYYGDMVCCIYPGNDLMPVMRSVERMEKVLNDLPKKYGIHDKGKYQVYKYLSYGQIDWRIFCLPYQYEYIFMGKPFEEIGEIRRRDKEQYLTKSAAKLLNQHLAGMDLITPSFWKPNYAPVYPPELAYKFCHKRYLFLKSVFEIRFCTAVMVAFDASMKVSMQAALLMIGNMAERFNGFFSKFIDTSLGPVAMIFFGAPLSDGQSLHQACEYAYELHERVPGLRIGMSSGQVRTGFVGDANAHEYAINGRAVRAALHLLGKARDIGIACDEAICLRMIKSYEFAREGEYQLDGDTRLYGYYSLSGRCDMGGGRYQHRFVGREAELKRVRGYFDTAKRNDKGVIVHIHGNPGEGKTRLAFEAMAQYKHYHYMPCRLHQRALDPIRSLMISYFGMQNLTDLAGFEAGFDDVAVNHKDLPGLKWTLAKILWLRPEDPQVKPEHEAEKIDAFTKFFGNASFKQELCIVLDDAQWLDEDSLRYLQALAAEIKGSLTIIATCRYLPGGKAVKLELPNCAVYHLSLEPMTDADVKAMIEDRLENRRISQKSVAYIASKAGGNPFFVEQIISNLVESGSISEQGSIKQSERESQVFSIADLINSRIDRYSAGMKEAIYIASVLGMDFDLRVFEAMVESDAAHYLETGIQHGIWKRESGDHFAFTHILLQESIYNRLNAADCKRLHLRVTQAIKAVNHLDPYKKGRDIARHYLKADKRRNALWYLVRSATYHMQETGVNEAISLQQWAFRIAAQKLGPHHKHSLEALFWVGLYYHLAQRYSRAEKIYLFVIKHREVQVKETSVLMSPYLNNLGRLYKDWDRYEKAEELLRRSLLLEAKYTNVVSNIGDRLNNLSSLFKKKGELHKSLLYAKKALKYFELSGAHGDQDMLLALIQSNIGELYLRLGRPEEAAPLLKTAQEYWDQQSPKRYPYYPNLLFNLHLLNYQLGRRKRAAQYLRQSMLIYYGKSGRDSAYYAQTLAYRANLLEDEGRHEAARKLRVFAHGILKRMQNPDNPILKELEIRMKQEDS